MSTYARRVSRAEFEALLHEHRPGLASSMLAEREAAVGALMEAFDGVVRTRRRRCCSRTPVDVSAIAEVSRQFAQVEHHDCDELTAARRQALLTALDGADLKEVTR
jgi:hypothetical protein